MLPLAYRDRRDIGTVDSVWTSGTPQRAECAYPQDHRYGVIDVAAVMDANTRRRKEDPTRPKLEVYAVLQKPGEVVVTKRNAPHAVVTIGQTYAFAKNFVELKNVEALYDVDGAGKNQCRCAVRESEQKGLGAFNLLPLEGKETQSTTRNSKRKSTSANGSSPRTKKKAKTVATTNKP